MSTKIYYAYRIPLGKLNEFIDMIRSQIFDIAEPLVKSLMDAVTEEFVTENLEELCSEEYIRFRKAIDLIIDVAKKNYRAHGIDIDFGLNIWIRGKFAYIIPIGEYYFKDALTIPD